MGTNERSSAGNAVSERHHTVAGSVAGQVKARVDEVAGGPARRHVVLLLAAILGLDTADKAALSSVAGGLKDAFAIGNTEIGILVSIVSFVGAILTLPMGVLVDRFNRQRLLWISICLWSVAMLASGAATSYLFLLVARIFLGVVTALAAPAVASLVGDFFPGRDRGRIYGLVLAGELVGLGIGFVVAGTLSSLIDWRWAFWGLVPLSLLTAFAIWKWLPEPARGGQSWLRVGAEHVRSEQDVEQGRYAEEITDDQGTNEERGPDEGEDVAQRAVEEEGVEPRRELVLEEDPQERSLWWAMKYILSVPTVRWLIIGSALVYFYFAGLRAFLVIYFTEHLGVSRSIVTTLALVVGIAAVAGVILGGRLSDRMIARGRLNARLVMPAISLVITVGVAIPAIMLTSLWVVIPLLCLAAAFLASANPPIDAARLDVIPAGFWGRAEAIRQFLRGLFEAAAPVTFGAVSQYAFGNGRGGIQFGGSGPAGSAGGNTSATGLEYTFLVMLAALLAGAAVAFHARRTYQRDVATAAASSARSHQSEGGRETPRASAAPADDGQPAPDDARSDQLRQRSRSSR